MRSSARRASRAIVAAVVLFSAAACGQSDDAGAPSALVDTDAPPLHSFDVYVAASPDGNISFADVYGVTLSPLRAYRLTAEKRISWISADADTVAVSAADEQVDKLGLLEEGGEIAALPGLGRPHGFAPEVQPDGTIRYEDLGAGEAIVHRYMSYDERTQKTRVLFRTKNDDASIAAAGPGDGFMSVVQTEGRDDQVLLMDFAGRTRAITVAPSIGSPLAGAEFVYSSVYGSTNADGLATDTALINPKTGKVRIVPGWAPLAWSPDRRRILVVRSGNEGMRDSELAVLDPSVPASPQLLGTLPGLVAYMAAWVERA